MDLRWKPIGRDSKRDVKLFLHPTASLRDVRIGAATDGIDLTEMMSQGVHTQFDCNVTLNWNYELFGPLNQPKPNQVLEVQLMQDGLYYPLWIGVISAITGYDLERGTREMQLIANSRDSLDSFRSTKRITELFPQLTDFTYIVQRVAKVTGLVDDEILVPPSGYTIAHTNTQLAGMAAWEMINTVCLAMGQTPFIDGQARLKVATRNLQGLLPSVVLEPERIVKVGAQRQRPPFTRVRLRWLDPVLKKNLQSARKLADATMTVGWFLPILWHNLYFSDDRTQRATNTWMVVKQSANSLHIPFIIAEQKSWKQTGENKGRIFLHNELGFAAAVAALSWWITQDNLPVPVVTAGVGATAGDTIPLPTRAPEMVAHLAFMTIMMAIGTGIYEIWGSPFEWIHARNTTEAFATLLPQWADNPTEMESDFVVNEEHAQALAVRELIYSARSANKWTAKIIDDPRLEYGDIIQFPDGEQMYIEDFSRSLRRGEDAILELKGFLVGSTGAVSTPLLQPQVQIEIDQTPIPEPPPESLPPESTPNPGAPSGPTGDYQAIFMAWVAGKPFGQATLLALEPTLNANGWRLTTPNSRGEKTKVSPPDGHWYRVGFGEGHWVWVGPQW